MNYLKRNGLSHRDWFIQVVRYGPRFGFCCHHKNLGDHTNASLYATAEAAIVAGCNFIDREMAIAALVEVLDELVSEDKISSQEFWNLSNFTNVPE